MCIAVIQLRGARWRAPPRNSNASTLAKARWDLVGSPSRVSSLIEHDLRANATRLSRGKTAAHFSGSCSSVGISDRFRLQRRIVDISFLATAIEGRAIVRIERGADRQPMRQVGIGDEGAAKC